MSQRSLSSRLSRGISLLILLLICVLTASFLGYFENQLKKSIARQDLTMLGTLAHGIDRQLEATKQLIDNLSQSVFPKVFSSRDTADQFLELNSGLTEIFRHGLHLFASDGTLLASRSRPPDLPFSRLPRNILNNLQHHKRPFIAPPVAVNHLPLLMILTPVLDEAGAVSGIIAGTEYLFSDHLLGRLADIRIDRLGYCFLIDRHGRILSHPDPDLLMKRITQWLPKQDAGRSLSGFEGSLATVFQGQKSLLTFKQLGSINWVLVANHPTMEAYAPIQRARRLAILAIGLMTALALTATWLLMRQLAAPLNQFTRQVLAVSGGDREKLTIPEPSPSELATLGEAFNSLLSDLKGNNRKLQEQQRFMESLLQNTAIACFALDPEHKVLLWNRACEQLTGIVASELIGTTDHWRAFYAEQRRCLADLVLTPDKKSLAGDEQQPTPSPLASGGYQAEGWYRNLAGQDRYLLANAAPVYQADGELLAVIQTMEDITELRRSHEEMDQTLSLLNATLESTADGIVVEDLAGRIVRYNQRAAEMWHLREPLSTTDDLHELSKNILSQLQDPQSYVQRIKEILSRPEEDSFDLIEFIDGRVFERISKPQLLKGTIFGRVWTFHDISERKELEENLRQAQKMEAVGQLAGGVAHDFNNLLTIINGYSEVLRDGLPQGSEEQKYAELVLHSGQRAADLTGQLLAFSRRQILKPQVIDLNRLIEKNRKLLSHLLREDMQLSLELAPALPTIKADPSQMEQILINLVINARDAMENGGRLLLSTKEVQVDREESERHPGVQPGAYLRLNVVDNGCGMSEEVRSRIFEPFYTTKALGKGTGLGLATAYGIVTQSQGFINVDSTLQQGTCFSIYLPVCAEQQPAEPALESKLRTGAEKILVVENEVDLRSLVVTTLQKKGYRVAAAESSHEALQRLATGETFDMLLSDIIMPEMNGIELAEYLRRNDPQLPILLMTGYADQMTDGTAAHCAFPVLQKPFLPDELVRQVQNLLQT